MIICPECGAQSPEESVYCDNCGATLLPVVATTGGSTESGAGNMQTRESGPASPIRRSSRVKTPEWLKGLEDPWDEGLTAESGSPLADEDTLVPSWLRGPEFEDPLAIGGTEGELESAPESTGPGDIPAWLREFDDPADPGQADTQPIGSGLTPAWLANMDLEAAATDTASTGNVPEWLAASTVPEPVEIVNIAPLAVAIDEGPGEEPLGTPAEEPVEARAPVETALDRAAVEGIEPQAPVATVESIPEWLRVLDIAAIQATLISPADARALGLLQEETSEEESEPAAEELPITEAPEETVIEGELIETAGEEDATASTAAAAIYEEEPDEFTTWLRTLTMAAAVRGAATPKSEAAEPVDERARLLAEVDELFYGAAGAPPEEMEAVDPLPQWLDEVLRSVDEFSGEQSQAAGAALVVVAGGAEADWLDEGSLTPYQDEEQGRADLGPALAGAATLAVGGAAVGDGNGAPPHGAEPDALAEAELPEWLAIARQEELTEVGRLAAATVVAESGPLAGIPGVLEREPGVYELQPPVGAVTEPALSPEQRQQLAVLQQLGVDDQEEVAETARPGMQRLPAWLQPAVALLLLAVIVVGLLLPRPVEIIPSAVTAAEALSQAVATAAGQPVLVAFEYSPAMAGELSPMAGVLLTDLAANGSTALLTSQSAAGITLGENLAAQTAGLSSSSPGYLPGEVIGLRQLAGCLSEPDACETLAGEPVDEALRQQLAEVALIVVLAAERDGLVSWVEQVSPVVDTPLYAGVTQSVAPLAAPYQSSGQLESVLAGFPAAVAYEQIVLAGEPSSGPIASQSWAYALALWLAAGLIVVGAIYWLAGRALRLGGGNTQ